MCGIAGILRITAATDGDARSAALARPVEAAIPESWLDALDASIRTRGPDGHGRFRDRAVRADGAVVDVALVHRRLSIIDHKGGAQPMVSASPRASRGGPEHTGGTPGPPSGSSWGTDLVATIFNGCIYNHRALRQELHALGHEFATHHSDTEVLLHGWRQWRFDLAGKLDGMFAWAIWDRAAASLTLARDSFGEKPLYLRVDRATGTCDTTLIAFASSPAALPRLWPTPAGESPTAREGLIDWLRFGWGPWLPFTHVESLPPFSMRHFGLGAHEDPAATDVVFDHATIYELSAVDKCDPQFADALLRRPRDKPTTINAIREALAAAVESRLDADVPIGVFLSGGIDSSLVAAFAQRARPDIHAFTVRMSGGANTGAGAGYDESAHAAAAAKHLGLTHSILDSGSITADTLTQLIGSLGLPFGDSSLLPTHAVSAAVGNAAKVALAGDGADELFLGYDRYRAANYLGRLIALRPLAALAASVWPSPGPDPRSTRARRARFVDALAHDGYPDLLSIFPRSLLARLVPSATRDELRPLYAPLPTDRNSPNVSKAVGFDLERYLPEDLLRKVDTASMAVPVEVRAPFLAKRVTDLALQAPIHTLAGDRAARTKGLLRDLATEYLPPSLVDRPKHGFAIPIGEWFRTDQGGFKTLLLDRLCATDPFPGLGIELDRAFIRRMLDEHLGTGPSGLVQGDHSQRLYLLLVLSLWASRTT